MRFSWRPLLVAALLAISLLCEAGPAEAAPTMTEFSLLTGGRSPSGITSGPDGNLWFAESTGPGAIGRITPSGTITEFTSGVSGPAEGITLGPDGNLWFTEPAPEKIGRITPSGTVTEFSVPSWSPHHRQAGADNRRSRRQPLVHDLLRPGWHRPDHADRNDHRVHERPDRRTASLRGSPRAPMETSGSPRRRTRQRSAGSRRRERSPSSRPD